MLILVDLKIKKKKSSRLETVHPYNLLPKLSDNNKFIKQNLTEDLFNRVPIYLEMGDIYSSLYPDFMEKNYNTVQRIHNFQDLKIIAEFNNGFWQRITIIPKEKLSINRTYQIVDWMVKKINKIDSKIYGQIRFSLKNKTIDNSVETIYRGELEPALDWQWYSQLTLKKTVDGDFCKIIFFSESP